MEDNKIIGLILIVGSMILTGIYIIVAQSWDNLSGGWGVGLWFLIAGFVTAGLIVYFEAGKYKDKS